MTGTLKIASWNVNSLRVRLPHVLNWLAATQTDILGVQETKVADADFPGAALAEAGYDSVFAGQKTYNGVALFARRGSVTGPASDVLTDLPGLDDPQRRVLVCSYGGWRIVNLYVPNGQSVGSDKYAYKLDWLAKLRVFLRDQLQQHARLIVMGDFNIAPQDRDVYDADAWRGKVLCSDDERAALDAILALGFEDSLRRYEDGSGLYSWWDYRAAAFRRDHGLRIDLLLASAAAAAKLESAHIDREPRGWERPSDHAPTVAEFTL